MPRQVQTAIDVLTAYKKSGKAKDRIDLMEKLIDQLNADMDIKSVIKVIAQIEKVNLKDYENDPRPTLFGDELRRSHKSFTNHSADLEHDKLFKDTPSPTKASFKRAGFSKLFPRAVHLVNTLQQAHASLLDLYFHLLPIVPNVTQLKNTNAFLAELEHYQTDEERKEKLRQKYVKEDTKYTAKDIEIDLEASKKTSVIDLIRNVKIKDIEQNQEPEQFIEAIYAMFPKNIARFILENGGQNMNNITRIAFDEVFQNQLYIPGEQPVNVAYVKVKGSISWAKEDDGIYCEISENMTCFVEKDPPFRAYGLGENRMLEEIEQDENPTKVIAQRYAKIKVTETNDNVKLEIVKCEFLSKTDDLVPDPNLLVPRNETYSYSP